VIVVSVQARSKQLVVEAIKSDVASTTDATSQPSKASRPRLVIRVELVPEAQPQPAISERLNPRLLALAVAVIVLLALTWVGLRSDRSDRTSAEDTMKAQSARPALASQPATVASPESSAQTAPSTLQKESSGATRLAPSPTAAPIVPAKPDAPASPVDEVLPDASHNALQTIRGTVRVAVRVVIDKEGKVVAASSEDPGPSRYFERLSLAAAKKWTFTSTNAENERTALVRFSFTREGVTARAASPQ
jgi:TonB family protein